MYQSRHVKDRSVGTSRRGSTPFQMVTIPLITIITAHYRIQRMTNISVKTLKIIAIGAYDRRVK